jgi:hypothetical protein
MGDFYDLILGHERRLASTETGARKETAPRGVEDIIVDRVGKRMDMSLSDV